MLPTQSWRAGCIRRFSLEADWDALVLLSQHASAG